MNTLVYLRKLGGIGLTELSMAALLALLCVFFRFYAHQPLSGDEPHYLVIAQSLVQDHDLDLKNNYQAQTYRSFYGAALDPHVNNRQVASASKWYSIHGVGLGLFVTPLFALSKRAAPALGMVVIAWLTLWLSFRWSLRITGKRALAWLCTWVLAGSIFFASLAGYLYPDMPVAALALAYLLLATSKNRRVQTLFVISMVAGLSLFFHFKSLVLFGPLVAWSLYGLIKDRAGMKAYIALLLPVGLSFVAFEVSTYLWFGTWLPNRIIGDNIPLLQISPLLSISAVLFDVGKGVFSNNPAYLLILPGLVLWHRHNKTTFWWAVLAFVPTFLMQATFVDWHGGFAPPGRYLSELLPLLVPAIGLMAGAVASRWGKAVVYMLILWQFILTSLYFGLRAPWALTGSENPATQKLGLAWLWPHFTRQTQLADRRSFWVIVLWLVVLTALALWGWHITKREHHA